MHRRALLGAPVLALLPRTVQAADLDVVVVGAGVAGLTAARAVAKAGKSVAVLEARDRAGGRIFSDTALGFVFDHGAPLQAASSRSAAIILGGKELTKDEYARFEKAQGVLEARIATLRKQRPGVDPGTLLYVTDPIEKLALGELLRRPPAWPAITAPIDVKADAHVKLGTRVVRIDATETPAKIVSPAGEYAAKAVIVAVPAPVLSEMSFAPPLRPDRKKAIEQLSMGAFDKVALAFSRKVFDAPADARILALTGSKKGEGKVVEALLRPQGKEGAIVFFSGDEARQLEANGASAAGATALSLLADIFGKEIRAAFAGARSTRWSEDRFCKGAWSVGSPEVRAALAAPYLERVFFAGEATADGGVMGAYTSGQRAAQEALAVLARR